MIEVYAKNSGNAWFSIACAQQQIIASSFGDNQQLTVNSVLMSLPFNVPFQIFHEPSAFAKKTLVLLKNIYDGQSVSTKYSLDLTRLPIYTQDVLKATEQIPLGYVSSYGSIAKAVGGGPRAVGNVMASNPFAPIVPCHRVVKSDFTLGGYGGGLRLKLELLGKEKRGYTKSKCIEVNGNNLQVFPVEFALGNFV